MKRLRLDRPSVVLRCAGGRSVHTDGRVLRRWCDYGARALVPAVRTPSLVVVRPSQEPQTRLFCAVLSQQMVSEEHSALMLIQRHQ